MGQIPGLSIQIGLGPELRGCETHIIYPQHPSHPRSRPVAQFGTGIIKRKSALTKPQKGVSPETLK